MYDFAGWNRQELIEELIRLHKKTVRQDILLKDYGWEKLSDTNDAFERAQQ